MFVVTQARHTTASTNGRPSTGAIPSAASPKGFKPRDREWSGQAPQSTLGPHLNYLGPHLNCLGHLLNYVGQHLNYLGHRDRGGVPFVRRQTRSIGVPMRCFDVSRCMNLDIAFGVPSAVSLRSPCMVSAKIKPHDAPSASARF